MSLVLHIIIFIVCWTLLLLRHRGSGLCWSQATDAVYWERKPQAGSFIRSWCLSHTGVAQRAGRTLSRVHAQNSGSPELAFSCVEFPTHFLVTVVFPNSVLCSSGQRDCEFLLEIKALEQKCQLHPGSASKLHNGSSSVPLIFLSMDFPPESGLVRSPGPSSHCSLSCLFVLLCSFQSS